MKVDVTVIPATMRIAVFHLLYILLFESNEMITYLKLGLQLILFAESNEMIIST